MNGFDRDPPVEAVMVRLVRLVLDDDWTADGAAARMREHADGHALRRALARVRIAANERPTPVSARAAATLELALGPVGVETGQPVARDWTQQSGPPASNRAQAS